MCITECALFWESSCHVKQLTFQRHKAQTELQQTAKILDTSLT